MVAFLLFGFFLWLPPLPLFPVGFVMVELIFCLYLIFMILFVYLFVEFVDPIVK